MDLYKWLRNQWDRALAVGAVIVGVVCLILGWIGVSGADLTTAQIPYLASGAVAGLFLLGIGATLWLSADLRDEWLKLDQIYQRMAETSDDAEPITEEVSPIAAAKPARSRRRVAAQNG